MDERRKEKRNEIKIDVDVINEEDGEVLGRLYNISPSGMSFNGKKAVDIAKKMQLLLVLPYKIFSKKSIDIEVKCVRSDFNADTQLFQSGFEFVQISQEDTNTIIGLIMEEE